MDGFDETIPVVYFNLEFESDNAIFDFEFEDDAVFDMDFEAVSVIPADDPYDGPYEATPTRFEQVFNTAHKSMNTNFVVHPIPKNYGLITWNGAELTVS